ncbi:RseA family anti-sigma factor [Shigella flexneri]
MQKEKVSALMDGETLDNELLNELSHHPKCNRPGRAIILSATTAR